MNSPADIAAHAQSILKPGTYADYLEPEGFFRPVGPGGDRPPSWQEYVRLLLPDGYTVDIPGPHRIRVIREESAPSRTPKSTFVPVFPSGPEPEAKVDTPPFSHPPDQHFGSAQDDQGLWHGLLYQNSPTPSGSPRYLLRLSDDRGWPDSDIAVRELAASLGLLHLLTGIEVRVRHYVVEPRASGNIRSILGPGMLNPGVAKAYYRHGFWVGPGCDQKLTAIYRQGSDKVTVPLHLQHLEIEIQKILLHLKDEGLLLKLLPPDHRGWVPIEGTRPDLWPDYEPYLPT